MAERPVTVAHGLPLKQLLRVGPAEMAWFEGGDPDAVPVLLLHGFPTHGYLWRRVMHELGDDVRSLALDLPGLGDTVISPYEDLSVPMVAELVVEWLDRMGLHEVALVAHDQGGAVAHQLVANHPERVSHLALVDSVAYDGWPVGFWAPILRLARTPGVDTVAYALGLHRRVAHSTRLGVARAVHDRRVLRPDVVDEYLRPLATPDGRERARRFLLAGDSSATMECVAGLRRFERPSVVVWGADDAFLSPSWGVRLAEDLPGAGPLRLLPFCGHLVPEERPAELAEIIRELLDRPS
jgi:pimeloyl-ACP methyl ester carboxylesterase